MLHWKLCVSSTLNTIQFHKDINLFGMAADILGPIQTPNFSWAELDSNFLPTQINKSSPVDSDA